MMKLPPVTGSEHYLTYKGARHLGACGKSLRAWRRDCKQGTKLEVSTVVEKFHNHCIRCWLYNVMHETLLTTKDEEEIAENLLDTIYCTCNEPHRSSHRRRITQPMRKRLEHVLRWLIEVLHRDLDKVKKIKFYRARGPRFD